MPLIDCNVGAAAVDLKAAAQPCGVPEDHVLSAALEGRRAAHLHVWFFSPAQLWFTALVSQTRQGADLLMTFFVTL